MKITIWIHKSEVISGNITNYSYTRPYHDRNEEWVEVQITQDEFTRLEDGGSDEENLFEQEESYIHERNPDTGKIRTRKFMEHSPAYYDYTRNMNEEQIEKFNENFESVHQELKDWFEGLSPMHQDRIGNMYGMFFNTFNN